MRITSIQLTNFKRFTDLIIKDIPTASKLVLLIGSNGSGKSSLFDAFEYINRAIKRETWSGNEALDGYFKKKKDLDVFVKINLDNKIDVSLGGAPYHIPELPPNAFYGRTSFRQVPRLTRTAPGQGGLVNLEKDSDRTEFFIDRDNRFENDIEKITGTILRDFFRLNESNEQIRSKYIDPINAALNNIFGNRNGTKLQLLEIIPPLEGKASQITFRKGDSEIHYNLLSAGEKEVFNVLMNLLSRGAFYQNTIYFFDEIDLHLNTKLQFGVLKEIAENWIPENCQLWTASHSLGFIEYAKQSNAASIIDFDDFDFDLPTVLAPAPKDNSIYEIPVGKEFLPSLFAGMDIYFVENQDADYYASVGIEKTVFVRENNRDSVYHTARATGLHGIIDRDFLSDDDILLITEHCPKLVILKYYSIENYLYHPDNLAEYCASRTLPFEKEEYISQVTAAKNQAKEEIIPALTLTRTAYPFFGEPEHNGTEQQNRFKNKGENKAQAKAVASYINSDDFETYYKSLPMKSYCKEVKQRQHISSRDLSKTTWFKQKIQELIRGGIAA